MRIQQGWNPYPRINNLEQSKDDDGLSLSADSESREAFYEGATITEMSNLMKSLDVRDAMNLDGGGSSVMIIEGKPTGPYSDESERQVSDAILVIGN